LTALICVFIFVLYSTVQAGILSTYLCVIFCTRDYTDNTVCEHHASRQEGFDVVEADISLCLFSVHRHLFFMYMNQYHIFLEN
jgi:hypothetical protein